MVLISIDEYEDFLEVQDVGFSKQIEKSKKELKKDQGGSLDDLYKIHQNTIKKEADEV